MMKQLTTTILMAMLAFTTLPAFSQATKHTYQIKAYDMTRLIVEQILDSANLAISVSDSSIICQCLDKVKADSYHDAIAVYRLSINNNATPIVEAERISDMTMSPDMLRQTKRNIMSRMLNMAQLQLEGFNSSIIGSLSNVEVTFVDSAVNDDFIDIYDFGNGSPVSITYFSGDDNSVYARAQLLFNVDLELFQRLISATYGQGTSFERLK